MEASSFAWPHGRRAAVSLTFDDARPTQADTGIPILDRHQARGTFFVSFGNMDPRVDQWRDAVAKGHEIGNHTVTHPCSGNYRFIRGNALESFTLQRMESELVDASAHIEQTLGVKPVSFAYPCYQTWIGAGATHTSYVPLVARHFSFGRVWGETSNPPEHCDMAMLMSIVLDGMTTEAAIEWVKQTVEMGRWLIFTAHDVAEGRRQGVSPQTLEAVCRYCMDPANGVWLDRMDRVGTHVNANRSPR